METPSPDGKQVTPTKQITATQQLLTPPKTPTHGLKPGAKAEITISARGIFRNEYHIVEKISRDGVPYTEGRAFKPGYCFINDLSSLDLDDRISLVANKRFEIIIDSATLVSGGFAGPAVLDQLARLEEVHEYIQQLRIEIHIPATSSATTLPENSLERKFLEELVHRLSGFRGLTGMDIVFVLPRDARKFCGDYLLPFFDLDTFKTWRVWSQKFGMSCTLVDHADVKDMERKHAYVVFKRQQEAAARRIAQG